MERQGSQGKTRHWKQGGSRASKVKVSKKVLEKLRRVNEANRKVVKE